MRLSYADTPVHVCGGVHALVLCLDKNNPAGWGSFVLAQSLLFASGADTLLLEKFWGVTLDHFIGCTDWLVHMMQIRMAEKS